MQKDQSKPLPTKKNRAITTGAMYHTRVWLGRLRKKMHPRYIRKTLKYMAARSNEHTYISSGVADYIEELLIKSELPKQLEAMYELDKGERSYLQIPLSQARAIEVLMKAIGAVNVLEVGTFRGFSTAFMARAIPEDGIVLTCDEDTRPLAAARRFWKAMGVDEKIHFELGMASKTLERLVEDEPSLGFFDAIFIDADKENYKLYVEQSMKLLKQGGLILIDNTLWKGLVKYDTPHDNGAEHMRAFNQWLADTYGRDAALIPAWDGMSMVFKR